MNSFIKQLQHVEQKPLSIERDYVGLAMGMGEVIIIEGVKYDAEYFRAFAHPETDVLYAVRREGDQVWLTVIRNAEEAKGFFNNTFGLGDQAPTEDQDGL